MKSKDKEIYLDNHLLLLYKEAPLLTQPDNTGRESLQDIGKAYLKEKFHKPGQVFLEPLFRLDRVVSGIVLFARTSKALSRLQESHREEKWKKIYKGTLEGEFPQESGVLEDFLIHDEFRAREAKTGEAGKRALLAYKVLERRNGTTLVEIELITGRYHQIRCQFAKRGFPIVGDEKYGSHTPFSKEGAIALCHVHLEFPHPITKELLSFKI